MPAPNKKHADWIAKLLTVLVRRLDDYEHQVLSQGAGLGIERVPLTYGLPNLMVFRTEARRRDRAETARNDPYIWAVPELIVECLSPSDRKGSIQELLSDYARIAAPEVWLLDPKPPQFTSYRYESGALKPWLTAKSGSVAPLLLPTSP
jgi:Uma2 family endonuclease